MAIWGAFRTHAEDTLATLAGALVVAQIPAAWISARVVFVEDDRRAP